MKIIITGSIIKISEAHVISPPITLNPHRTVAYDSRSLYDFRSHHGYCINVWFSLVNDNLVITLLLYV